MRFSAALLPAILFVATAAGADEPGEDHALLPRYPDADLRAYRAPSTDEVVLPVGPVGNAGSPTNTRNLTGRVTHIDYAVKPAVATLQIAQYYRRTVQNAGFRTLFSCTGLKACGAGMGELILNSGKVAPTGLADGLFGDRMRVIVAQRGANYVLLHIYEGPDRSVIYEAVVEGNGSGQAAATGPRVHTSRARDVTDCGKTQGGPRTVAGIGLGTLLGSKVIGGSNGILAGAAAAGIAGDALDRKARCGPTADIESNAAPDE